MYLVSHYSMTKAKMVHDDLHVNVKYNEWKIAGSQSVAIAVQMALSVIAVRQLIFQFSIEKQYPNRVYQIETFFSEENWLIFVEFKGKDAWEAAVFPATAQVNTGNQPLATVATEKPRFGEIVAIFAIGLWMETHSFHKNPE